MERSGVVRSSLEFTAEIAEIAEINLFYFLRSLRTLR